MAQSKAEIVTRYGRAFFSAALDAQELSEIGEDVNSLQTILAQNPGLLGTLQAVEIPADKRQDLLTQLLQFQTLTNHFIQLVYDYGRITFLDAILADFVRLLDEHRGIVRVQVKSAVALSQSQQSALQAQLITRLQAQQILLEQTVDPSILGGVVVSAQNMVIDGSVATRIEQVKQLLLKK